MIAGCQLTRFLQRVFPDENGCWNFSEIQEHTGYGKFHSCGVTWRAHRWILFFAGKIKRHENICVLHACDNRACVNPEHLFLGSRMDNAKDMIAKGRNNLISIKMRGSKSRQSKLTEDLASEIFNRIKAGERGVDLAKEFKISKATISEIKNKRRWTHIHED